MTIIVVSLLILSAIAWLVASRRSLAVVGGDRRLLHSRAVYHALYAMMWVALPSLLILLVWVAFEGLIIDRLLVGGLPKSLATNLDPAGLNLLIEEIKAVAGGTIFGQPSDQVIEAAERYQNWQTIFKKAKLALVLASAVVAILLTRSRISRTFRARRHVERLTDLLMIICATLAILTTLGIVLSLGLEALRFFASVSPFEFLFGLNWQPQLPIRQGQITAGGAFGAVPVYLGTLLIALIAMTVAIPVGLLSAIYLSEYAGKRLRRIVKPLLEILAGIPTIVYGFFAVLVVAPALRNFGAIVGLDIAPNSALAAGAVMGIMLIPFISSFADDALSAVPDDLRQAAYGLGATMSETIIGVLLPAALPGIMAGVLLAVSRAIGETMIVVMAAGIIASMTLNPFEPVTTVTVQIVTLLIGDSAFDSPKTLAAFALGLVLFLITLGLNVAAIRFVRKYRQQYQ